MFSDNKYLGIIGGRLKYLCCLLQGGIEGGALIWIRDVGDDSQYRPKAGGFPPQGGPPAGRDATAAQFRGDMRVFAIGGGNVGNRPGRGGDVCPLPKNTIDQYIVTHTILDMCLEAYRKPGEREDKRWWEQGELDLEGAREATQLVEVEERKGGSEDGDTMRD